MAFMGIFLTIIGAVIIVVGTTTTIAIVLYVIALIVGHKAKKNGKKHSVGAIILSVAGTLFMVPLGSLIVIITTSAVQTKIDHTNNLGYSVKRYDFQTTEKLLKEGYSPECELGSKEPPEEGKAALLTAVICDRDDGFASHTDEERIRMIKLLIEYGADVNAVTYHHDKDNERHRLVEDKDYYLPDDRCGYTPLLYAVYYGDFEVVKILAENGADVTVRDWCGFNVVSTIADNLEDDEGAEMLRYLIENGADAKNITNFHQDAGFLADRNSNPLNQYSADNDEITSIIRSYGGGGHGWQR